MDQATRMNLLKQVYAIYDDFVSTLQLACKIKCAECCTCNVTVTSLEGYGILERLKAENRQDLLEKLKTVKEQKRFQPKITTNQMADICSQGQDISDEDIDPNWGACPLLVEDECALYDQRPFECRSFCSTINCREAQQAKMDPFVISVNTVFRQFIEHMDSSGASANFTDMLIFLESSENKAVLFNEDQPPKFPLIRNFPAKILMVPPEHVEKIRPIYNALQKIANK